MEENFLKIRVGKSLPSEEMDFSWEPKDIKEDSNMVRQKIVNIDPKFSTGSICPKNGNY